MKTLYDNNINKNEATLWAYVPLFANASIMPISFKTYAYFFR